MRPFSLLFLVGSLLSTGARLHADLANGIVVVVNEAVITYQQVETGIAPFREVLLRQFGDKPELLAQKMQSARAEIVDSLIMHQLIIDEFKSAGYNLPEKLVDDVINDRIRQRFGDRVRLTKTLQADGITYETFRQRQREEIIFNYLREKNLSQDKILISPHKIETYYQANTNDFKVGDQVKLRMIVINQTPTAAPGTARQLATEIAKKIEEGASFADMASVYTEGSQRNQGGDRGWVERSYYKKEISDVAFSLKKGERSQVIDQPEAAYLLLVEDVRPAHVRDLAGVRGDIEKILKDQEGKRLQKKWFERMKNKAFVRSF